MFLQINGLGISPLQKSNNPNVAKVDIIANHLTRDLDGETVLKEAFNPETVKEFLDIGVLEFWHESRNPDYSKEEKNKYLIGKPVGFRWEGGKPVVTAELTKSHPIVKDMLPHLEAGQPVYAASIGGAKMVLEVKNADGAKERIIPKIKWDHLAIAPINSVINREPGNNVRLLKKANDLMFEFDTMETFSDQGPEYFGKEEELRKALLAPASVSDMQPGGTSGGAITKQSLESTPKNILQLGLDGNESLMFLDTIIKLQKNKIPASKSKYMKYFEKLGKADFGRKSYALINKYFKTKI